MQETQAQSLGQEDPLEKRMTTHTSILAWKIPWSLAGYSPWGHKKSDTTEQVTHTHTHTHIHTHTQAASRSVWEVPHSTIQPEELQRELSEYARTH